MVHITYFVHGTTIDNENGVSSGWSDADLSPLGLQQSIDLKRQIGDNKFDIVFCSDQKRAVASAKLTFGETVPIVEDARLRECNYGKYNGQLSAIVEPLQENMITARFPDGESYEDVKTRVSNFLEMLKRDYDGKRIAIVAHKAPQLALEVLLQAKTWQQAFAEDWRKRKTWQPGWNFRIE